MINGETEKISKKKVESEISLKKNEEEKCNEQFQNLKSL